MIRPSLPALVLVAACAAGCGASRGDRVRDVERTQQKEQEPDRLIERGKAFASVGDNGADPDRVLPLLMRVYIQSGRYRLAIQTGEQYLTKKPEEHALRFLVATLYAAVGKNDLAKDNFERVIAAEPKHADAHYALAVLLRDSENDLVGADYHFREYLKLKPKGPHADEARGSLLKDVP
jgi:tetratricopeptide (TPR) repeat protein